MQKSEYADMYHSEDKLWWYIGLRDMIGQYLGKYARGKRVLDAGCGTGKNMEFLDSLGYKCEGIDVSDEALKFCRQRGISKVKMGSIDKIPYRAGVFDVVICLDVLGILEEDARKRAMVELSRVLKPGGVLLLNSAALESLRSQHDDVCNLKRRFSVREIRGLVPSDMEVQKLSYRVFLLFPIIAGVKILKRLFRSNDSEPVSDQFLPWAPINWLLLQIQLLENMLIRLVNLPWGSSVFLVARKVT